MGCMFLTEVEILKDHTPAKGCLLYMSIDNSELGSSSEGMQKEASDLADPGQGWPPPGSRLANLLPRPNPRPLSTIQATKHSQNVNVEKEALVALH